MFAPTHGNWTPDDEKFKVFNAKTMLDIPQVATLPEDTKVQMQAVAAVLLFG